MSVPKITRASPSQAHPRSRSPSSSHASSAVHSGTVAMMSDPFDAVVLEMPSRNSHW